MKIRSDFVTNSSSSSFIIATKQRIPTRYADYIKKVTHENIASILVEPYMYNTVTMDDDLLQEYAGFTNAQMSLIKIAIEGELNSYIEIIKRLDEGTHIYNIYEDRDWLYDQKELNEFIYNAEILDKKTDL